MISNGSFWASLLQLSINFLVYIVLILCVFQGKFKCSRPTRYLVIAVYVVASIVAIMLCLLPDSPFRQYQYFVLVLWLGGSLLASVLLLSANLLQLSFLFFVILDIQYNLLQIAEIVNHLDFIPHFFERADMHFVMINLLVLLAFLPPIVYLFLGPFKKVANIDIDRSYWKYLFILPVSAYVYCVFNSVKFPLAKGDSWVTALFMLLLLNAVSYMSYVAVLKMLIKTYDSLVATAKMNAVEKQLLLQREQYQKLTDSMSQTERQRHDLRHHFVALKGYLDEQDDEGARSYLEACLGTGLPLEQLPVCENRSVDLLLRYFIAQAKENGIAITASVVLTNQFEMSDTDLCVVFGNLVENAFESCKRQREGEKFITIKAKQRDENMVVLTVANSYSGSIIRQGEGFLSQKHEGAGLGTFSVRNIVEKNGGICKFSTEDHIFKVSVLLIS